MIKERLAAKGSLVNGISSTVSHIAEVYISSPDEKAVVTGAVAILNFLDLDVVEVRVFRVKSILRGKHDKLSMEDAAYVPLCDQGSL